MFFVLSWWKPKWVHLDVICIIHTVQLYINIYFSFCSITNFWNWVGFEKDKRQKKDIHRLSNFYNWWFICILYPWSFLYWKLKEKKNLYWGRGKKIKNCLAYQCGLALTRSWVWPLAGVKQFFFFFFSLAFATKWCLIFDLLYPPWISVSLTSWISFRGGGGVRIL